MTKFVSIYFRNAAGIVSIIRHHYQSYYLYHRYMCVARLSSIRYYRECLVVVAN
jgi:hypothetical protein